MKKQIHKFCKILVLILVFFLGINFACSAYETVIIRFPDDEGWRMVYSNKTDKETIVQFMPRNNFRDYWVRTVVFHSYANAMDKNYSPIRLQQMLLQSVVRKNKTFVQKNIKVDRDDVITIWCVKKNNLMNGQCEILRTTRGYESVVSIHYVNKNIDSLKQIERNWINIIKNVNPYYSYYRMDRMLNREENFEF